MIPTGAPSSQAVVSAFVDTIRGPVEYLKDYETAGVAISDGSQGVNVKLWRLQVISDKKEVQVSASDVPWTTLFVRASPIAEAALAFDNNMNPFVAFVEENGNAFIYWFDPVDNVQKFTALPSGVITPRCCIDDHRIMLNQSSDVVLAYLRGGSLYVRYQRERYQTEHLMQAGLGANARLVDVGMNRGLRFQWWMRNANPVAGAIVQVSPFLGDVVKDLCRQAGIQPWHIDVRELYGDIVHGLKVDSDDGLTTPIEQLRDVFFFDKAEYDKKIHFPKRGRNIVARIPYSDLVRGNPTTLKEEREDEAKMVREVNINHLDPEGGFAKNKQYAHRRSNMVKARAKKNIDTQVVLTVDQAATVADTKLRVFWNEIVEYKFSTTIKWSELTPGDRIEVEGRDGTWHQMRIEERNEDGNIDWECKQDAGHRTYGSVRTGTALPPPTSTTPGVVGETLLEIVDISPLRDQDDELGLYIAAAGVPGSTWSGYQLLVSVDGGTTHTEALRGEVPATMGEAVSDVLAEAGHDITSAQTVEVTTNYPLVSVGAPQLAAGQNRFALGGEVCQFETATQLGMVGPLYHYELSGLRRALYGTTAAMWPAGSRFVMLDEAVSFVQAQRHMIGLDIYYKPVSYGLTEDETVPTSYLFDTPDSQIEWVPDNVAAVRDAVSNDVLVTWDGRPRLGQFGGAPYHSKYFRGYRVEFSDSHVMETMGESVVYPAAPAGVTVQVAGINEITGVGPYTAAVST